MELAVLLCAAGELVFVVVCSFHSSTVFAWRMLAEGITERSTESGSAPLLLLFGAGAPAPPPR